MARVAIDAMGGDHAPREVVLGAVQAVEADADLHVLLVGREDEVRAEIPEAAPMDRITVVHAADVIEMDESPVEAFRRKADSSIARTLKLLAAGEADAAMSAGNTGGAVAGATFLLKRLPGTKRGGIAVPLPGRKGACVLMDVGANLECRPLHLVQYAMMAREFSRSVVGVEDPRVGVLSVGGEAGKGNKLVKSVGKALRAIPGVNFIGNVEGQDVFLGGADVVVCDGFVGNVILKSSQGLSEAFFHLVLKDLRDHLSSETRTEALGELEAFRRRTDYAHYGGAPLMGHRGTVFICHGRSHQGAIRNAVHGAAHYVTLGVEAKIAEAISELAENEAAMAALEGSS